MSITAAQGFAAAGVRAGIKQSGNHDLALVRNLGPRHVAAGVFTSNRFQAAPVVWSQSVVADGSLEAVVLNSGGANACTGPDGLADRRRDNGPAGTLTPVQQAELYQALQVESPDGGLWTGPKVARYVRDRWGVEVVPQTGWRWLNDLGFSLRVPRPRHPRAATLEQQRRWL